MQNVASRILTFTTRREHIRPVLYSLLWLPVIARIEFKVVTMKFKCSHGMASEYVTELMDIYRPPRVLCSGMKLDCASDVKILNWLEVDRFPSWLRNC